ncbi:hypothetical protein M942_04635 [Enterobacter ludwigii]|jgi:hypothetical protein|uniref:hypothetical protein n=1 Tax=Enterobacter ludwigii TaxID=299767 RepID=UPI0003D88B10|nr:hypothetical protein [Enterobacter ludwigii]AHE72575.1 hypothetical protein M942_04635 [Enterobacter ludwigii]
MTIDKQAQMAAENAALKSVITDIHSELYGHGFAVAGWHLNGALKPLDSWFEEYNWEPETPATDAFLAEVRAQGVEMFADYWEENCRHNDTFIGGEAKKFAAQLRKGVQS